MVRCYGAVLVVKGSVLSIRVLHRSSNKAVRLCWEVPDRLPATALVSRGIAIASMPWRMGVDRTQSGIMTSGGMPRPLARLAFR